LQCIWTHKRPLVRNCLLYSDCYTER